MDECVRELTFEEEVRALEIDETTKERIIAKAMRILEENHLQGEYLFNCHCEIDRLKGAIVEQSKMIYNLAEEKRNMGIHCNF